MDRRVDRLLAGSGLVAAFDEPATAEVDLGRTRSTSLRSSQLVAWAWIRFGDLMHHHEPDPIVERSFQAESGERITWVGRPGYVQPSRLFDVVMPVFGIVSLVLGLIVLAALTGLLGTIQQVRQLSVGTLAFLWAFGLLLTGIGLHGIAGPFIRRRRSRRTRYLVTDRRAVVIEPDWLGRPRRFDFPPNRLVKLIIEPRDGQPDRGDVIFERFEEPCGSGTITITRGFLNLDSIEQAHREVQRLLSRHAAARNDP
jgi:hypothetical protein